MLNRLTKFYSQMLIIVDGNEVCDSRMSVLAGV